MPCDRTGSRRLSSARRQWEDEVLNKALRRFSESREQFRTISDLPVDRLYDPTHVEQVDYVDDIGFPGQYPFTRGVQPTMYRGRPWTMRQYAGFASAEESNQRYRYLLSQGQTGLSVAFDLPTQVGYDSDHPMAQGEVGRVGVAIDSVDDVSVLFNEIPLDKVTTSMTINAPAAVLLAMYVAVAEKQGVDPAKLGGTIQNDILKEYAARGTYIFPPHPSMRLVTDVFAYCSENLPLWNTISISGYHIREAGSTAVQEVAFTLANGIAYVQAAMERGLDVDRFAPRLSFFFNSHIDFLEEVAKFRAARRLWARIMRERFKAKNPRSWMLRFHTQTAGSSLTAQQADNNVVRVAYQALAAVLGGTQSLHTNSRDEALALPTEASARLALRTQQVLAHETGVTHTIDPLGGSYYIERLTTDIEEAALAYIERIDGLGGAPQAIEKGFIQREIQESAYRYQQKVEREEEKVVGVNCLVTEEEPPTDLLRVDPKMTARQHARLEQLRKARDNDAVMRCLESVSAAAQSEDNLIPYMVDAVTVGATLGEICGVLREVFGEYQSQVTL